MATLKGSRNNTLAGTLVIASILGMILVIILLAGGLDILGKRTYTLSFDLTTGVEGVEKGSRILLAGQEIGSVSAVSFYPEDSPEIESVRVRISVDQSIQFREGVIAFLQKPLLGSTSTINFVGLGEGADIAKDAPIAGRLSPPGFLTQAGYGDDQQVQLQNILAKGESIAIQVEDAVKRVSTAFVPKAESIADDVKTVTADVRAKWPAWSDRIDEITESAATIGDDAHAFIDNLNGRTDQIRDALASAQVYLDENRDGVRETIANARSLSGKSDAFIDRLNGDLYELAKGLLESGKASLDKAGNAIDEAQSILVEQRPNVRESFANFRLSSDQLKDTLLEIRAAPWRLLYRPNVRELEYELLYNSARSYARAVSEIHILTDRLDALISKPAEDLTDADRKAIAEFVTDLARTRETYEKVEDAFLDQLIEEQGS